MVELPTDLMAALPESAAPVVQQWWASLTEANRQQVAGFWDQRLEVVFFAPQLDEAGRLDDWEQIPTVVGGRFVPPDDAWGLSEWGPGYFEHLLQHPELVLVWEPVRRVFHIGCTQHMAARVCLVSGYVPVDFQCPLGSGVCPLQALRGGCLKAAAQN